MFRADPGCTVQVESVFGPEVSAQCLNGFDFTLLFEETFLTILPLGILCFLLPWRIVRLWRESTKTRASWLMPCKLVLYATYCSLQFVLLGLWARPQSPKTHATLAATILTVVLYIILGVFSYLEHLRSLRPSTLLITFLGVTALLDLARVRTLCFIPSGNIEAIIFLSAYLLKVVLFLLETCEKRQFLQAQYQDVSSEATAGLPNRFLFLWINQLFLKGFRGVFTVRSLPKIDEALLESSMSARIVRRWEKADKSSSYALLWVFTVHFRWAIFECVPPKLIWIGMSFAQPFLVKRVLDFIDEPKTSNSNNVAYGLIGAYAIVFVAIAICYAYFEHKVDRLVLHFRGSLVALIFEKTIRLQGVTGSDTSALTLFSQDVARVCNGLRSVHNIWVSVIELALAIWLLEYLLGVAILAPALFVVIMLLAGMPLADLAGNAQGGWLEAIEPRLAVTAKAIESMTSIKATGATSAVSKIVLALRETEIAASGVYRLYTTLVITVGYFSNAFVPVLGFGTYIILAEKRDTLTLTQGTAFAALTLFVFLTGPVSALIDGWQELKSITTCFKRIQEHLMQQDRKDYRNTIGDLASTTSFVSHYDPSSNGSVLELKEKIHEKRLDSVDSNLLVQLSDVTATWTTGKPVLGPMTITLQQHNITMIAGPIGCGKTTLLRVLLAEVPEVTGKILTSFRVAALCTQAPWLKFGTIQSNILGTSIWDSKWYDEVTRACDLQRDFAELTDGDQTKIGVKGSQLSGGQRMRVSLARALYSRCQVLILDDVLTGLDRRTEENILRNVLSSQGLARLHKLSIVMTTCSIRHLEFADEIIVLSQGGTIEAKGSLEEVSNCSFVQILKDGSSAFSEVKDAEIDFESALEDAEIQDEEIEDDARRTGDTKVYYYYFQTAGWWVLSLYLFTAAAFVFGTTFPTVWIQWWTNSNDQYGTNRIGYWVGTYAGLAGIAMLATFASSYVLLMVLVPITARRFHRYLLETTVNATSGFLTSTDSGKILNRFSQDLELIDMDLPQVLETTIICVMSAIAEGVLVFIGSGYVACAIPGVLIALYLIQNFYLRTSRQLRLLDIEAKAPIFSHFLETLAGVTSVRSYGWSDVYVQHNVTVLNESQKPYYLLFTVQRWLNLVLNLLVAGLAILLVGLVTTINGSATSLLGAALFNVVNFGVTLEQLVTDWTQLEQSIGAVSRIRSYVRTTPRESVQDGSTDPQNWPENGKIQFENVTACYESSSEPALKNVSLVVNPGEKVAICGRTGSGKTSFISTILRTLDPKTGSIYIDNVDIANVSRLRVRSELNTVSQSPFFLHGSIRLNLDPQNVSDEVTIVNALKEVGLYDHMLSIGDSATLDLDAEFDETQLSHGQRQLFSLARALCKPSKILILDEPTSSIDVQTARLLNDVIFKHFEECTILQITHQLGNIARFDKVVVLDNGSIAEVGAPLQLLDQPNSWLRRLVGESTTADLPE